MLGRKTKYEKVFAHGDKVKCKVTNFQEAEKLLRR